MLLAKHRKGDVNIRATWIFSKNDVIASCGVILSGGLVYLLGSPVPDLVVGTVIAFFVIRGEGQIIKGAEAAYHGIAPY